MSAALLALVTALPGGTSAPAPRITEPFLPRLRGIPRRVASFIPTVTPDGTVLFTYGMATVWALVTSLAWLTITALVARPGLDAPFAARVVYAYVIYRGLRCLLRLVAWASQSEEMPLYP